MFQLHTAWTAPGIPCPDQEGVGWGLCNPESSLGGPGILTSSAFPFQVRRPCIVHVGYLLLCNGGMGLDASNWGRAETV